MIDGSLLLRCVGIALIVIGTTLVWNPELVSHKPIPSDAFQATESRIWWGLLIGFGALLLLHQRLHPWIPTLAATGSALLSGLLVARLIGIMLDGPVLKQWINVGIEVVLLVPLVWWYLRVRT
jgi:hypothetical protein